MADKNPGDFFYPRRIFKNLRLLEVISQRKNHEFRPGKQPLAISREPPFRRLLALEDKIKPFYTIKLISTCRGIMPLNKQTNSTAVYARQRCLVPDSVVSQSTYTKYVVSAEFLIGVSHTEFRVSKLH